MKVARSALRISLALRERAGVRETVMAAATYIFRGGADAMAVSLAKADGLGASEPYKP
jgi:Flp pilus assembly protein CpaB